ncbi:MAG: hypothetical protein M1838_001234 [Thelocarpon superellum]|nr:MAG: hypothetical protein M1838_001234 [Thelocarpon superellum]
MARPRRESRDEARRSKPAGHRTAGRGERERAHRSSRSPEKSSAGTGSSHTSLSIDALAKLDAENARAALIEKEKTTRGAAHGTRAKRHQQHKKKRRVVSGLLVGVVILLLVILVPVGVLVIGKQNQDSGGSSPSATDTPPPSNANLNSISPTSIPESAKGSILDPFVWYDTTDFNVTYTDVKVGGLPIMGLNSTWDDTTSANNNTPPLNKDWSYGTLPIRGVNIGGWLSIEPFITPSLFSSYDSKLEIVDEYTLCQHLGPSAAATTLEKHYATFVNEQTFIDVAAAGLDHVRIPYSYWAVVTYPGDPYVPQISWRYLLRGIEWARKHGLRVNLDLHALPGSQNGWNHSGRQGVIGWLNGTDGDLNAQRSADIHGQLSQFFAQPRYKNVVTIYGLVNEPKMTVLPVDAVEAWYEKVVPLVQKNGVTAKIAFGDGFLGLPKWKGQLSDLQNLVLDAHQYVIFNTDQLAFTHQTKVQFSCTGWASQMSASVDTSTGFGPTLCGEWSQADTDCAQYLNNVNVGARWTGTLNVDDPTQQVLTPSCPPNSGTCECDDANADPSKYSSIYKQWLMQFAEAQMLSFEIGWGWFYWTWDTEAAVQWSYKKGLAAGILPPLAYQRNFNCSSDVSTYAGLPENY